MQISVIVPTLNEAGCIKNVLDQICKHDVYEIIVVDGHSTDGTVELVKKMGYKLIFQDGRGLGNAIQKGIENTTGDIIMVLDADGSHDPRDMPRLLKKIQEGYDLVVASRYLEGPNARTLFSGKPSSSYDDTPIREFGNRFLTFLCRTIYRIEIHDVLMGFKIFRRNIFDKIVLNMQGQEFDAEIVIKAKRAGFKIGEVPAIEHKRTYGKSKLNAAYHGFKVLWVIVKCIFY